MVVEEVEEQADVLQLIPGTQTDGGVVQIVDASPLQVEQQGRMGGDDKLGTAGGAGREKLNEVELQVGREAVFGLIEQVEPALTTSI